MNRKFFALAGVLVAVVSFSVCSADAEARCCRQRNRCCQPFFNNQQFGCSNNGYGCGQRRFCGNGCGQNGNYGYQQSCNYGNQQTAGYISQPMNTAPYQQSNGFVSGTTCCTPVAASCCNSRFGRYSNQQFNGNQMPAPTAVPATINNAQPIAPAQPTPPTPAA